jgi:hypothetical protein
MRRRGITGTMGLVVVACAAGLLGCGQPPNAGEGPTGKVTVALQTVGSDGATYQFPPGSVLGVFTSDHFDVGLVLDGTDTVLAKTLPVDLNKKISARAMRRTFQDLAREANIDSIVQRSICGHATQEMSQLYSTVGQKEIQRAVGKVISISGYRELTLSTDPEYARSMHAKNRPSEGSEEAPSTMPDHLLTN